MAEELQNLLERIQKDGVDKAETEANSIIADAKKQAESIISNANSEAKASLEQAEQDGLAFAERGKKALTQAARDVVLSVNDAIIASLTAIINSTVSDAISGKTLEEILVKVVDAYCSSKSGSAKVDVLLNEKDQKQVVDFFSKKFADEMKKGLDVKSDSNVVSGFKISMVKEQLQHDFSNEAITEALSQILRPHLADIVKEAQKS